MVFIMALCSNDVTLVGLKNLVFYLFLVLINDVRVLKHIVFEFCKHSGLGQSLLVDLDFACAIVDLVQCLSFLDRSLSDQIVESFVQHLT